MQRGRSRRRRLVPLLLAALIGACSDDCVDGILGTDDDPIRQGQQLDLVTELSPSQATVEVGETVQLTARLGGGTGTAMTPVSYSSGDRQIATVDAIGRVTGVAVGQTVIEASTARHDIDNVPPATATINVVAVRLAVDVSPGEIEIAAGETAQFGCTVRRARTGEVVTGQSVAWSSADPTVAVVAPDGTVIGVEDGTTQIICTLASGETGSATVTVKTPVTVEIDPSSVTLSTGDVITLVCTVRNANTGEVITGRQLTWSTSNANVARVTDGVVLAEAEGTATITCTLDTGESASAEVTVVEPLTIEISPPAATMTVGSTATFRCAVTDAAGNPVSDPQLTWSTSEPNVANVSDTGDGNAVVGAIAAGSATITCALPTGESASAEVTVTEAPQPPNISEIAGGYSVVASGISNACPAGTFPNDFTNPGPIQVTVDPSGAEPTILIRSTADVVGPYDIQTGDYKGDGIADVQNVPVRETVDGRWERFETTDGFVVRLKGIITYEILVSGGQVFCSASYNGLFTKLP